MTDGQRLPIFDGHNDTLLELHIPERGGGRTFFERSERGHIDLPRAREAGFAGGLFAINVLNDPAKVTSFEDAMTLTEEGYEVSLPPPIGQAYAYRETMAMIELAYEIEKQSDGQVRIVRTADALSACLHGGVLAMALHIEGAEPVFETLENLSEFYEKGVRSLGIVWSRENAFGQGVPFKFPSTPDTGPGLSDAGRALVGECNRLGMLVDTSHLTEKGFWDVAEITDAPLVASHSCAYELSHSTRNLTDRQLDAIGESGGIVGLNFCVGFIRADGWNTKDTPLEDHVRHIAYIAERIGIDHVGLGSDFDGASISDHIGDVTGLPRLIDALRKHGFDESSIRKIAYENWLRVLGLTWKN